MTAINTINSHLVDSASYPTWLALQLASLKGDAVVFQSWKTALQSYPAYYSTPPSVSEQFRPSVIPASGTDVNPEIATTQLNLINSYGQSYSTIYQSLATVHPVEADIGSVISQYVAQPLSNILRIVSLFNALKGLSQKTAMTDLVNDVTNYSFVRLGSDVSGMLASCDLLTQLGAAPLQSGLGSIGAIIAGIQSKSSTNGSISTGPLSGLSNTNSCAQSNPVNKIGGIGPIHIPGLGALTPGLQALGEMISFAQIKVSDSLHLINQSFQQIIQRRLASQNNMNQLMCLERALDALLSAAIAVAGAFQKGTISPNSTPQAQQQAANSILNSLRTGANTTFVANGSNVIVNPPTMPPITPQIQNVLTRANIRTTYGVIQTQGSQ